MRMTVKFATLMVTVVTATARSALEPQTLDTCAPPLDAGDKREVLARAGSTPREAVAAHRRQVREQARLHQLALIREQAAQRKLRQAQTSGVRHSFTAEVR